MSEVFSGKVQVQDRAGNTTVSLDAREGNIYLGGAKSDGSAGQDGDLHVRDNLGNRTILLNGNQANITVGGARPDGSTGTHGDIIVKNSHGSKTIELQGNNGNLLLGGPKPDGGPGQDGDLVVRDNMGANSIHLDGNSGEIKIKNWSIAVADYVFDQDYELLSLEGVSDFIDKHGHLPDVPSSADFAREGVNMTSFSMVLLQKIEELTLYIVEQNEELVSLKKRLCTLENGGKA